MNGSRMNGSRLTGPRRILVVGSGAREHALCWRLAGEPGVERVIAAPGNPLMVDVAEVHPGVPAAEHAAIIRLAQAERADLVVVGPEAPLVDGLADSLAGAGIACFGPSADAARLESSKAFARAVCEGAAVPMAEGRAFESVAPALEFARRLGGPVVVKADGLAAGKGVAICPTSAEAEWHVRAALEGGRFGQAGRRVVIERCLDGREASVIALCDGLTAVLLPAARDHKRLGEGDSGPNTGGMGAYSPVDGLDQGSLAGMVEGIFRPVLAEMARRGAPFRGALFAGLMLTPDGPRVLEFNVRLGDPETQAMLPRLAVPLAPLLLAAARGELADACRNGGVDGVSLPESPDVTVAITLAADGYPDAPRTGDPITGLDEARARGGLVFGAGVRGDHGALMTAGGRVLSVVGRGPDVAAASEAAYHAADAIHFTGRQLRHDIGRAASAAVTAA